MVSRFNDEMDRAVRLILIDPRGSERKFRRIRRAALRSHDSKAAAACLKSLFMLASLRGDTACQFRCAMQLSKEAPNASAFLALGFAARGVGRLRTAMTAFRQAMAARDPEVRKLARQGYEGLTPAT